MEDRGEVAGILNRNDVCAFTWMAGIKSVVQYRCSEKLTGTLTAETQKDVTAAAADMLRSHR